MSINKSYSLTDTAQERAKLQKLMTDPEIANKVATLAEDLSRLLGPTTKTLIDLKIGARFREKSTGVVYQYEGACTPYKHNVLHAHIMEIAGQPFEALQAMTYMVIREVVQKSVILSDGDDPVNLSHSASPPKLINGKDFIKYFAIKQWELLEQPEKMDAETFLHG